MNKYLVAFSLSLILFVPILSNADPGTGSIVLNVKNQNGDVAGTNSMAVKVYLDNGDIPYMDIEDVHALPLTISPLPLNHQYKIEVYENSMHATVGYVNLNENQQSLTLTIPNNIGMRFFVLYNDGTTPIAGARVSIKSNDDKLWNQDTTDNNGQTQTFWESTTTNYTDFYYVEVSLSTAAGPIGSQLEYIYSPIIPTTGGGTDIKIITDWPPIVSNLIAIQVYKTPTQKVDPSDGNLVVQLRDYNNNVVTEAQVNPRGEADISNIKVNPYFLFVVKKDSLTGQLQDLVSTKIAITGSENIIPIYINNPELNSHELNCHCVAFRLDDVQDYYVNSVQMEIIKTFVDRNASLTVGIIGEPFGKDTKLVNYLRNLVAQRNPIIEPAIHSWDHRDMIKLNSAEQFLEVNQTSVKLQHIFGIKPDTFIPPFNHFNDKTLSILQAYNITHISYHVHTREPPPFTKSTLYQFPATEATASIELLGIPPWKVVRADDLFQGIKNDVPLYGYAVVNMHPYEFADYNGLYTNYPNQTQIQQLGILIDKVKEAGYKIVPIDKIDSFNAPIAAPPIQIIQTSTTSPNCDCVAFRLENVQDHYLSNVQDAIIKSFQTKDTSLTLGLLGKQIGANPKLVSQLNDGIRNTNAPIQLANRGWDDLDHTQYAEEQQSASIKMTSDKISKIFGVTPTIFIPPFNKFNNDTLDAMHENGIRYLSSAMTLDAGPYNFHNAVPFHVPQTTQISYLLENDPFYKGTINEKAVAKIKLSLNQTGFSVVTFRIQDFAVKNGNNYDDKVDSQKLQSLESLLDFIKNSGVKTVTIDQIPQMATSEQSPSWTNNIYAWYQQGVISHQEVLNAINYLIHNNIIKFNN